MQFYTVIGSVIIAWCGIESAKRLNREIQRDIRIVDAYLSLLRYIRTQIDLYALPIGEIFEKCDKAMLFSCGWKGEELPKDFRELFLCGNIRDKMTKEIISEFCADFGRNYREEELKKCGFIQENDTKGVSKMLKAAAFTYVATFLASALQVIRLVMATRER